MVAAIVAATVAAVVAAAVAEMPAAAVTLAAKVVLVVLAPPAPVVVGGVIDLSAVAAVGVPAAVAGEMPKASRPRRRSIRLRIQRRRPLPGTRPLRI